MIENVEVVRFRKNARDVASGVQPNGCAKPSTCRPTHYKPQRH